MDTRFWGPSGWRLLHSITFAYIPRTDKSAVREMFLMLPFVLPCKFCRASLSDYMEKHPLEPALESQEALTRWLYIIHNEVNAKLRNQKLHVEDNPPFEKVKTFYTDLLSTGCTKTEFPGWDFLFSIADLHPYSKAAKASVPISGAPCSSELSIEEKNKWNCLKPSERLPMYERFWNSIGKVLPYKEWRKSWNRVKSSPHRIKWLWKVRCSMENDLNLLNRCKYSSLCRTLKKHRSGCNKSKNARTCRRR